MAGIVVVFDFDSTIIECDSDNWVLDETGFTEKFYELLPTTLWNPLMDRMMGELHSEGKTIEEIVEILKRTPLNPRIVHAIEAAYSLGCDLKIVSDANMFFIETILKHHGVRNCFSEIIANPSYGVIIERIQNLLSTEGKKKFIYLGDGNGDFCPSLKLKENDYLMPRKYFPLSDLVSKDSNKIKAEVHGWKDGEELENILVHIINKEIEGNKINNNSTPKISIDCKLGSIPIMETTTYQPLPKALPVRH
ncbi:hypothetical protein Ahy_A09g046252 [Arachis hypogaea]|uniref:Inorganic pyrophosphatase n=1 Tax=Arachis hypogaea TaxID=3818 RepID=A0A445BP93_ARAHY|nr:hypothetical protein Ahy_A09g046252 [Arachis hypogaea]